MIAVAILLAFLYTLPNFFGESPAVQVSSARATVKVDPALLQKVQDTLKKADIPYRSAVFDPDGIRVRFDDTDTQYKAKDLIHAALNPGAAPQATPEDDPNVSYVVALNLLPASPNWLSAIRALPMYLGLDLRGGVHFLLQVDMQGATTKRLESIAGDIRSQLREKSVRHGGVTREGQTLRVRFRDAAMRERAREAILGNLPDLAVTEREDGQDLLLVASDRVSVYDVVFGPTLHAGRVQAAPLHRQQLPCPAARVEVRPIEHDRHAVALRRSRLRATDEAIDDGHDVANVRSKARPGENVRARGSTARLVGARVDLHPARASALVAQFAREDAKGLSQRGAVALALDQRVDQRLHGRKAGSLV